MFTILAWQKARGNRNPNTPDLGVVETVLGLGPVARRVVLGDQGNHGLCVWDPDPAALRMPRFASTSDHGVAMLGVPLGAGSAASLGDPEALPLRLALALRRSDSVLANVAPPFALVSCDTHEGLAIYTDGLGMARMYQAQRDGVWAWSNRPAALAAAGAAEFEEDEEAWATFAACGWFAGMSSPFYAVRRLRPAAVVLTSADGRVVQRNSGVLQSWVQPSGDGPDPTAAATAMVGYVRDAAHLASAPAEVMLSGGRDSRVVSAAAVAAGIDATFTTLGPLAGEIETAGQLIQALQTPIKHRIREPVPPDERAELRHRVLELHRVFDGDLTPVKMNSPVSGRMPSRVLFGGAGGEIAHANYYPSQHRLDALVTAGRRAPTERLQRYFRSMPGATVESYARMDNLVENWIGFAHETGIHGASSLDFFYLIERFRRWAPAANSPGSYPAFAVPEFITAAFQMRPHDRLAGNLHSAILRCLVPPWADVPFYKASASDSDVKSARKLRIWQGNDAIATGEILDAPAGWDDVFDVAAIRDLWRTARTEGLANRFEAIFQRVVWRALFRDYLSELRARATAASGPGTREPGTAEPR